MASDVYCPLCKTLLVQQDGLSRCEQCGYTKAAETVVSHIGASVVEGFFDETKSYETPRHFGRYEIIEEIGAGGMGRVYKGTDPQLNRFVAVKVLFGQTSPEYIERFMREARALANLRHPNIVSIYDIGHEQGKPFFAMEFVEGNSLKKAMQNDSLTLPVLLQILIKTGRAVEYAHQHGIIHRDLKPANILLDRNQEPRVLDFGLAKITRECSSLSQDGMVIGTLYNMPPEQAGGRNEDIDARSDVYALGTILYEMLTQKTVFTADSTVNMFYKILHEALTPPSHYNPNISLQLEKICLKALEKNKEKRYQSAAEFVEDLAHCAVFTTTKTKRTRYTVAIVSVLVLLCLAGSALLIRWSGRRPTQQQNQHVPKNDTEGQKGDPDQNLQKLATIPKNGTGVEERKPNTSAPVPPQQWPVELWQKCWYDDRVDFTCSSWRNLSHEEQFRLARTYQIWYAEQMKLPVKKRINAKETIFNVVLIPPGRFSMGSPMNETYRTDENQHSVVISKPFWLGIYEVSQAQWEAVTNSRPAYFQVPDLPVERVSWEECQNFCNQLQLLLPTEAQWEYACRAGTLAAFNLGPNISSKQVNYGSEKTLPSGTLPNENAWGLYDMHGNVKEWCRDIYETYTEQECVDPVSESNRTEYRIFRGGSWHFDSDHCRSAWRGSITPRHIQKDIGFRISQLVE